MGQTKTKLSVARDGNWLSQLLLVMLFVRALIPTGYMPDFGSSTPGKIGIVICSAHGTRTVFVDGAAPIHTPASQSDLTEPCAFSGLAQAFIPLTGLPEVVPADDAVPVQITSARRFTVPPVRAGPVLGSRAPPSIS